MASKITTRAPAAAAGLPSISRELLCQVVIGRMNAEVVSAASTTSDFPAMSTKAIGRLRLLGVLV